VEKKFRFLDGLAMADVAFEAFGSTIGEMFKNAGLALESVIVDLSGVRRIMNRELRIKGKDLESLLFDFLSELVYLQSAEGLVFSGFDIRIKRNGAVSTPGVGKIDPGSRPASGYTLNAECFGEKIDLERHELGTEVKGVTMHKFEVGKSDGGWRAQAVLDV